MTSPTDYAIMVRLIQQRDLLRLRLQILLTACYPQRRLIRRPDMKDLELAQAALDETKPPEDKGFET